MIDQIRLSSQASERPARSAIALAAAALLLAAGGESRAVSIGDSLADVMEELGPPDGRMVMGSRTLLTYDRGEIVLEGDTVVEAELMSEAQAEVERDRREAAEREREEQQRIERERRRVEGMEIRARKLADEAFLKAPAAERVAFWRSFQESYPSVALGEEYSVALKEYEMELQAKNAAAAATAPPPAAAPPVVVHQERVYVDDPFTYSSDHYMTTYGDRFYWYGSRLDPVLSRPARSHTHERPSHGYGYQDAIQVPERPPRHPVRPLPPPHHPHPRPVPYRGP